MKKRPASTLPPCARRLVLAMLLAALVPAARADEITTRPATNPPPQPAGPLRPQAALPKEWSNLSNVLKEVAFPGVPLAAVMQNLRNQFRNEFDVLLPEIGFKVHPEVDPATGLPTRSFEADIPANLPVNLRLNNVTISQVFRAMNLMFEINRLPLQWELTVNGSRPTAVLRILDLPPPGTPAAPTGPSEVKRHAVYYVGDLLGPQVGSGLDMRQVVDTVRAICREAFDREPRLSIHEATQLLVVTGTSEQLDLVRETLTALKERARLSGEPHGQPPAPQPNGTLDPSKKR